MRQKNIRSFAPRLIIMVKQPIAGRVKTRLAKGIGSVSATAAYRNMLTSLVARLASDPRWMTVLAVSPDMATASRMLPNKAARISQGGGDLGQRLQRVTHKCGRGPVVVIGTDSPSVMPSDIASAFEALGSHDAVLGPSRDGGYWLVGLKRCPRTPRVFDHVRWSTEHTLADTRANLAGRSVALLGIHGDVDEAADLRAMRHVIGRRILPTRAF
jgi:rSAM/selenodomain-associated transferase 1